MTTHAEEEEKSIAGRNEEYFDKKAPIYDISMVNTIEPLVERLRDCRDRLGVGWLGDDSDDEDEDEDEDEMDEDGADVDDVIDAGEVLLVRSHDLETAAATAFGQSKRSLRVLDYACGTGLATRAFAEFTSQCIGVDISGRMVSEYNKHAYYQGLYPRRMLAIKGDLTTPEDPQSPEFNHSLLSSFDVAICVLAFHHFADPYLAARRMVERLRPGGVLCVVDFLEEGPPASMDPELRRLQNYTVEHHGFSREQMRGMFVGAGAGEAFELFELGAGYTRCGALGTRQNRVLFLARGTRAGTSS